MVDRQVLATTLRIFDFANPDLHIPVRSETTVPQQALFALNHPFAAKQAQALIERINREGAGASNSEKVRRLYQIALQREPTSTQLDMAQKFLEADTAEPTPGPSIESLAWQYGYGELDETANHLKSFQTLPYFSGSAWQGGAQYPDGALGWVQLTATGGHQYLWAPVIFGVAKGNESDLSPALAWKSERDFSGPAPTLLNGWEQLAQVLLISNELMFVD